MINGLWHFVFLTMISFKAMSGYNWGFEKQRLFDERFSLLQLCTQAPQPSDADKFKKTCNRYNLEMLKLELSRLMENLDYFETELMELEADLKSDRKIVHGFRAIIGLGLLFTAYTTFHNVQSYRAGRKEKPLDDIFGDWRTKNRHQKLNEIINARSSGGGGVLALVILFPVVIYFNELFNDSLEASIEINKKDIPTLKRNISKLKESLPKMIKFVDELNDLQ